MSVPARIFALALVAACLAVAGCGGNDNGSPIPAATARSLDAQLDGVQARIDQGSEGACKDILEGPRGPNKQQVQDLIESLPDSVDADVRSALQDSFDNLWDVVQQECDDKASKTETNTTTTETPTNTTPTDTTPTDTTPTDTTPTDTTTTPTAPDEAPLPNDGTGNSGGGVPGAGNGNGNGNDKADGNSGGVGPGD
jgi:hypothetical protein